MSTRSVGGQVQDTTHIQEVITIVITTIMDHLEKIGVLEEVKEHPGVRETIIDVMDMRENLESLDVVIGMGTVVKEEEKESATIIDIMKDVMKMLKEECIMQQYHGYQDKWCKVSIIGYRSFLRIQKPLSNPWKSFVVLFQKLRKRFY